ncbi:MAG: hypothetical protein DYG83_02395 [Candidatus Brocadia sp. AMX2]|uniref:Uncharacterized protein n=1 Tax=Candidatus Brocadia sinica JPN1 TaxID=1197129 RepID=A0ABQ0JWP4_9BACT|nr:MAG: hypothetical protein EDM70_07235 [Candidatus Brocadia sp. AMX2]MBC6930999.1 hypothetical protein [Candidatus Brocadia sp.]MBL1168224.1 hypothetical protein [Candidatus Brocadia sp. AMX1]GAN33191.1 hypothetical protein BROSI_A1708 [Candidatus Brocadia sinica JPN1]MCE7865674.1 hypothetical protein [Candidatus Brocadia sp. AMX2]
MPQVTEFVFVTCGKNLNFESIVILVRTSLNGKIKIAVKNISSLVQSPLIEPEHVVSFHPHGAFSGFRAPFKYMVQSTN